MTFFQKIKDKGSYKQSLKIIAVVLAAFLAGICFRRSAGLMATFPIAFLFCALSACIKINPKTKLAIFGLMVFALNTVETEDIRVTLTFTALCLLACLLSEISVSLIRNRQRARYCVAAASAIICIALSVIFIGSPIAAIKASRSFKDYANDKYFTEENGGQREYSFSKIYYNYNTKSFEIQATDSNFPTEIGLISIKNGRINDGFQDLVQSHLAQPYVTEITAILRKTFTDESFSVSVDDIYLLDQREVISAEANQLWEMISFEITLGGVQTANDMERKVKQYTEVLDNAGVNYGRIVYKSGISPWVRRTATVTKERPMGDFKVSLSRAPIFTSNRFNRFAKADFGVN